MMTPGQQKNSIIVAAKTAWGEARGEGPLGMQAVLSVIGNRAKNPGWWGHDICSVCLAPEQFDCWDRNDPNYPKLEAVTDSDLQFKTAHYLASKLVAGTLSDYTNGADSYYRIGTPIPKWAIPEFLTCQIGHHAFYKVGLRGDGK